MASKKYYWLKMNENFFDDITIKMIESMDNGVLYTNFLLKLYLRSVKTEGKLMFNNAIPYDEKMLSILTGVDIDIVRNALIVFENFGIIEKWDDGTLYMSELQNMIGSEGESAQRVRKHRAERDALLHCNNDVTNSNTEIELELDLETELETELEKNKTPRGREVGGSCFPFNEFWNAYGKKIDSKKCKSKYSRISEVDREVIKSTVNGYVLSTPDVKFRKNPLTYLNGDVWNDVVVESPNMSNMAKKQLQECSTVNNNRDWIV